VSFQVFNLHFSPTFFTLGIGIAALVIMGFLCVLGVVRSTKKKRSTVLESLRFFITSFIVLLLWKAEWRTIITPNTKPRVAILWDDSASMNTIDSQLPSSKEIISRAEFSKKILQSELWQSISNNGKNELVTRSFSTPPADPILQANAGSNIDQALDETLEKETNLRATILISDGDWNIGKPPVSSAQKYALRNVPIFTIAAGTNNYLPDIDLINVSAPTYGIVGENIQIPFSIRNSLQKEIRTTITLNDQEGKKRTKAITLSPGETTFDSILWKLEKEGSSTLELSVPVMPEELLPSNNSRKFTISGKPEKIQVLLIDSLPRWEYRFLKNALSRDPGVKLSCLLFHPQLEMGGGADYLEKFPEKIEDLAKYDVIFIGDVGIENNQLTPDQCKLIRGLVESQASGLVFLPGSQGNQFSLLDTELSDLIPVYLDATNKIGVTEKTASPLTLTSEGSSSLLTMLGDTEEDNAKIWYALPGFYWHAPVEKSKAGSTVLAVDSNHRTAIYDQTPLIVTKAAGSGKVLFMGIDSAWRWRRGVEDKYHYRFWGQVARWMSYQRNMATGQQLRLFYAPERPSPGDSITLNANAFDENGAPLQDGNITFEITPPSGAKKLLVLTKDESSWGLFSTRFIIDESGAWKIKANVQNSNQKALETTIFVQPINIEKVGLPAKPEVLEEISRISQGQIIEATSLNQLVKNINLLPETKVMENLISLWSHWLVLSSLILLLTLFWIARKFSGQI
jgi:uncharacterized membrane protein